MWVNNQYFYSTKMLKVIAESYATIYDGFSPREGRLIMNPQAITEYKADFDIALKNIGKGIWTGNIDGRSFKDFRHYGRLQQI